MLNEHFNSFKKFKLIFDLNDSKDPKNQRITHILNNISKLQMINCYSIVFSYWHLSSMEINSFFKQALIACIWLLRNFPKVGPEIYSSAKIDDNIPWLCIGNEGYGISEEIVR